MSHKGSFIKSKTYSSSKSFHPQCPLTQDSLLFSSKCVPRCQKTECSPLLSATFKPYVSACTSACLLNFARLGKSAVLKRCVQNGVGVVFWRPFLFDRHWFMQPHSYSKCCSALCVTTEPFCYLPSAAILLSLGLYYWISSALPA